jgi:hypothetical protein
MDGIAGFELSIFLLATFAAALFAALAQGYSHVRAICSECARITEIPWGLLVRPASPGNVSRELAAKTPTLREHRAGIGLRD